MLTQENVIEIIAGALEVPAQKVTIDTTNETVENWDRLTHLGILERLDRATEGKSTRVPGLATAFTVKDILENLKNAGLH